MYICYEDSMYVSHIHVWLCNMEDYLVPKAKACRSRHDYELGPRESKRRSGNIGLYFERLVQAMEGERENTRPPEKKETRKRSQKQEKQNVAPPRKKKRKRRKTTVDTRPPEKRKEKEEKQLNSKRRKKRHEKKKKKKKASGK